MDHRKRPGVTPGRPPGPCGLSLTTGGESPYHSAAQDLFHRELAGGGVEPIEEQHPVEMVGLVLNAARHHPGPDDLHRIAELIEPLRDHVLPALRVVVQPRMDRQPSCPSCSSSSGKLSTGLIR